MAREAREARPRQPRWLLLPLLFSTFLMPAKMELPNRDDGEAAASIRTILSFNSNKRADLGGLYSLLKECKAHLVFLQEVCSYNALSALASSCGYRCWASTFPHAGPDLICAVLSRLPNTDVPQGSSLHSSFFRSPCLSSEA